MPYYICEFCNQPIEIHKFNGHRKKVHPKETSKKTDLERLKRILNESKNSDPSKGRDPLSLWFEVAKKVFSEIEKVDATNYTYVYDWQIKKFLEEAIPTSHAPHPPTMLHLKGVVKNQKLYHQWLKKHKGTKEEKTLKAMIKGIPVVIVCKENYDNLVLEWRRGGKTVSDMMILTVFFYLHEMYHINGYGERDADVKAANSILEIFGNRIAIPDYEIERWREYRGFRRNFKKISQVVYESEKIG